jgi:translocation and assembly module TamB
MIRRRIAVLFLPVLLILLVAGAFAWLLHTESGAAWVLERVAASTPGQLKYRKINGDLQSGLRIMDLDYHEEVLSVTADTVELLVDLGFWPPAVNVHDLRLGSLEVRQATATEPGDATSPGQWLPALSLPLPVEIRQLRADRIAWYTDSETPSLEARGLSLSADWFRALELHGAEAAIGSTRWQGDLAFGFQAPHSLDLDLFVSVPASAELGLGHALEFHAVGSGDLLRSRWELRLNDPGLFASGELRDLLGEPGWDLQLAAGRLQWPLDGAEPTVTLGELVASSYGIAGDYGLELDALIGGTGIPELEGRLVGTGDAAGLDIQSLDLEGDAGRLQGMGRIDWQDTLQLQARLGVLRLDPGTWLVEWGGAEPVEGQLELKWKDQKLDIERLDLVAQGTFEALQGSAVVDLAEANVAARLNWRNLAWPPGSDAPYVTSADGSATLRGRLDDWGIEGELAISGPDYPPGRLQVRGTGDADSLHFDVPGATVLGGSLAGTVDLTWQPDVHWSVMAQLDNLATAPLLPSFPGRVSGELSVRGRPEPPVTEIDISELRGVIRERQVRASGGLVLHEGQVTASDLRLRSGGSSATLDGRMDGPEGLAFTADIQTLADLLDGASGSFTGSGIVSVDPSQPVLGLDGEGHGLSWGGINIGELVASTERAGGTNVRVGLRGVELGETRVESMTVISSGELPLDHIELSAHLAESRVELQLDGRVNDWRALLDHGWSGQLRVFRLDGDSLGFIALEQPADLHVNDGAFALAPACFGGSREGRLCLESTWRTRGERTLEASLEAVSPNLALNLLGSDFAFTQLLSGTLDWRQQPGSPAAAQARLQIAAGEIIERGEDEPIIRTGAGLFGFKVAEGRLYEGNLDIPFPGAGGIKMDFGVPDLSAGLDSPVQGRLLINLANVEPILHLFPGVEGTSGPLSADMNFSGSLADPKFTGHASLVRGTISHFASGLVLEDIRLAGAVYQYDQTELSGTFRAGGGQGTMRAVLNFGDILKPELLLQINGDNLTLVNVPDLTVTANPDIRLVWREGVIDVGGRVVIPAARLSPRYLPTSASAESADVVIVAGVDPLIEAQPAKPTEWRIRGELELQLGEDVQLQLDRAKAQLRGTTQFKWETQLVPVADGGFSLSGEIYAYGQLLKVTEGRINFSGRPADNPFLNIRAEREIYGNSQISRAGVLVTGTLKRPILEPYSVPMTTRERALALLITGSDIDYEQGVGTVEVGMYVAPKLFISYGIGLFEDQNVISARYDLGKGFGIKTTSGQRETGADVTYTIER